MTREEAIKKLNWALDNNTIEDVQSAYDYIVALKLAIQALEKIEKIEKLIDDWTKMEELEWKIREVLDNENDD